MHKKSRFNVILAPILKIFYGYTPRLYKNTMNEFDIWTKIEQTGHAQKRNDENTHI